jgi:sulfur carrier protein
MHPGWCKLHEKLTSQQTPMQVLINAQPFELPEGATVADALAALQARPPYAVAVNTQFVPATEHPRHPLHAGDRVEVISPVTGG